MAELHGARIHGPCLALLLNQTAVAATDCDGLLFGRLLTTAKTEFKDSDQEAELSQLVPEGRDPVLGWVSVRAGSSPDQASMREAAVTQQLCRLPGSSSSQAAPCLFALLTRWPDHNGATLSLQYSVSASQPEPACRLFHALSSDTQPLLLRPVTLDVLNLAASSGHKAYTTFAPTLPLPPPSGQAAPPQGSAAPHPLAAAASALTQQVAHMEGYHQALLRDLHLTCRAVSEHSASVQALMKERQDLLAALT
ncbi:hypothetical protein QJQ45_026866 [Haematococcus lacustris]|nr:hypothetical protein QJQ45_026866 [Haematococcus lacustris]